jgi:very-short-patch-repair endonuclease
VTEEGRDRRIQRIAARQRTLASADQLRACGVSKRAVEHRVAIGRAHVVFRGVYSFGCGELPPLGREQAAVIACGEHAFLSHRTAAAILGLVRALPEEVEVSVVGRRCASRQGIRVHQIKAIDRREVQQHEGLWVSTPARAVLELAALASAHELARAIDDGLAKPLFTPLELRAVLERNRPCRGAARLAAILGDETAIAVSRSLTEKRLLRLLRDAHLPLPETNVKFGRFELDYFWRRERLAVEIDGYQFHRGPAAFKRDHEKTLAVRDAGIELLRFTADQAHDQPTMVLARIAGELARRPVAD